MLVKSSTAVADGLARYDTKQIILSWANTRYSVLRSDNLLQGLYGPDQDGRMRDSETERPMPGLLEPGG